MSARTSIGRLGFFFLVGLGLHAIAADPTPSFGSLLKAAQTGDATAEQKLGMAYYYGQGTPKDFGQAFTWASKAAAQGDRDAEYNVAYFYLRGQGVPANEPLSFQWYQKAADQGGAQAQRIVGKHYQAGIDVPKDPVKAVEWYRKASIQGDTEAQLLLAICYLKGDGVAKNPKTGFTLALGAASYAGTGGARAAFVVAECYLNGDFVPRDPVKGYAWGLQASTNGLGRETVAFLTGLQKNMTPGQIAEAQKQAATLPSLLHGRNQTDAFTAIFAHGSHCVIPIKFEQNAILIPLPTPDGKAAYLFFDTGAAQSFVTSEYAAQVGLEVGDYVTVGGIGENIALASLSRETTLTLPGLTFHGIRLSILSDFFASQELGEPVVGVLGSDVLKDLVVRIDFVHQTIEFIQRATFQPEVNPDAVLQTGLANFNSTVKAHLVNQSTEAQGYFVIDTGNTGSIDVAKGFQDRNPQFKITDVTPDASAGLGGMAYSSLSVLTGLDLGGVLVANPIADFEHTTQGVYVLLDGGTIGNDIWRRFDFTLDFTGRKLYLRRNAHFGEPFMTTGLAMHVLALGSNYNKLTVVQILPGSLAQRTGFHADDVIVQIDGDTTHPPTKTDYFNALRRAGEHHLMIRRGDQTLSFAFTLTSTAPSP